MTLALEPPATLPGSAQPAIGLEVVEQTIERLLATHGRLEETAERVRRGVRQVAERWWAEDGDAGAFADFCAGHFIASAAELQATFERLERALEQVEGHLHEARRELVLSLDVDTGPLLAVDHLFGELDLGPQLAEGLFRSKVAFLALLNFPLHTLAERLAAGPAWNREQWARSRMMDAFAQRVPPAAALAITRAYLAADRYITEYNLRLDRLLTPGGERPFPEGLRLISHWGLRDELASHYAAPGGVDKQRLILTVMERIVRQEVPAAVVDNPDLLWDPVENRVSPADPTSPTSPLAEADLARLAEREPDTRYARLLDIFHAVRGVDPYSPTEPTFMARRFERDREIPEAEVEALLVAVLESPEVRDLARVIAGRLGRALEPFDIWYSGFKPRGGYSGPELDALVQARFPTVAAFKEALPQTLTTLGFAPERAGWLADHIAVEPARGAGHALGAARRGDRTHLRTRVPKGGMDYQGYNTALHELGHNVEQVFSLEGIDRWWLYGVPNTAFTEAFAFTFQERDLELLGLRPPSPETRRAAALATLWNTYEIAGVSLVDMRVWHWMYEHPESSPAELRAAVLEIAGEVWNRWFLPHFGSASRDSPVLAIYSHMIQFGLYLPDYALGHLIAFQVSDRLHAGDFGAEVERLTRQGRLTPDAWMRGAVGGPISPRALLDAAREALARIQ